MTSDVRERKRHHLRRIEGQVRGLQRMVDDDASCVDILTQVASVTKSLQSFGLSLVDDHLRACLDHDADTDREALADEAVAAIGRLLRT